MIASILAFVCGSLFATIILTVIAWRDERMWQSAIRHVRANAYREGRRAALDERWSNPVPVNVSAFGGCIQTTSHHD